MRASHITYHYTSYPRFAGTSSSSDTVSQAAYQQAVIAAVLGTFFGTLLLGGLIMLVCRARSNQSKNDKMAEADNSDDAATDTELGVMTNDVPSTSMVMYGGGMAAHQHQQRTSSSSPASSFDASNRTAEDPSRSLNTSLQNVFVPAAAASSVAILGHSAATAGNAPPPVPTKGKDLPVVAAFPVAAEVKEEASHQVTEPSSSGTVATATAIATTAAATSAAAAASTEVTPTIPSNYLRVAHAYVPRLADEVQLLPGDILYLIKAYDDGWAKAYNLRTGKEGIFPMSFAKRVEPTDNKAMAEISKMEGSVKAAALPAASAASVLAFAEKSDDDAVSDRASSLHDGE